MDWYTICALITILLPSNAVRLHKLFQFVDGIRSDQNLRGWLHVGNDYAVFLIAPHPHDKYLTYELYETRNEEDINNYKPTLKAISQIPIEYIKDQLAIYRDELYEAKYKDLTSVPGTRVKTLREWQIDRALDISGPKSFRNKPHMLRTLL